MANGFGTQDPLDEYYRNLTTYLTSPRKPAVDPFAFGGEPYAADPNSPFALDGGSGIDPFAASTDYAYDPNSPFNLDGGGSSEQSLMAMLGMSDEAPPPAPGYGSGIPAVDSVMESDGYEYDLTGVNDATTAFMDSLVAPVDQNRRFEETFAGMESANRDAVAAELASDPRYGGVFSELGGDATVTQFGQAPATEPSQAWMDATGMRAFDYDTGSGGRELGGLAGSEVNWKPGEREAFEARRAEKAANPPEQSLFSQMEAKRGQARRGFVDPMDYVDPIDRMRAEYDMEMARQEGLKAQAEQGYRRFLQQLQQKNADREYDLKVKGVEADAAQRKFDNELAKIRADNETLRTKADVAAAGREGGVGGLTQEQLMAGLKNYRDQYGDEEGTRRFLADVQQSKAMADGGPAAGGGGIFDAIGNALSQSLGLSGFGGGDVLGDTLSTSTGGSAPRSLLETNFPGQMNAERRSELMAMDPQAAFDSLVSGGNALGRPMSKEDALALINEMHPDLLGNTIDNPGGTNWLANLLKVSPMPLPNAAAWAIDGLRGTDQFGALGEMFGGRK